MTAHGAKDMGIGKSRVFEILSLKAPFEEIELFRRVKSVGFEDLKEKRLRERKRKRVRKIASA